MDCCKSTLISRAIYVPKYPFHPPDYKASFWVDLSYSAEIKMETAIST